MATFDGFLVINIIQNTTTTLQITS